MTGHRGPSVVTFQGLTSNPGRLCSSCFLLEGGTLWVSAVRLCFVVPVSAKDSGAWKDPEAPCFVDFHVQQMTVVSALVSLAKAKTQRQPRA